MRSSQQYFWYSFNRYHIYYIYSGLLLMIGWPDLSWSNGSSWNHLSYVHLFDTFYIFLLPFLSLFPFLLFFRTDLSYFFLSFSLTNFLTNCLAFLYHLPFSLSFLLLAFLYHFSFSLTLFLSFLTFLSHIPFSLTFLAFLSHLMFS